MLVIILFSLISGMEARAEDGHNGAPQASMAGFAQVVEPAAWSGQPLWFRREFTQAALLDGGTGGDTKNYNRESPETDSPDWRTIKLDTAYFIAYQFVAIAVIYMAPDDFSGWQEHDKEDFKFHNWIKNVSHPVWDKDDWWINYIMHPYWGGTYYILGRERGLTRSHSFWFSFLLSSLFEYGAESLFEHVSIQDVIVTPVAGALLGEYMYSPIRQRIRAHGELNWSDKALLFITNPLGMVNDGVNRIFGVNTQVNFSHLKMRNIGPASGVWRESEMTLTHRPVWGLQVNVSW